MASAGGGISDEVPTFHAENLTSNVKSINYRFLPFVSPYQYLGFDLF
jgi:hypothetical protein